MITISEIREKYPHYKDLTDEELADSLHSKHYSDIPREEFYSKIGLKKEKGIIEKVGDEVSGAIHMPLGRSLKNIGQGAIDLAELAANPAGPGMKYLSSKNIPYISEGAKHWPQFPKSDIFGLEENQPGDELFQAAIPVGPSLKGAKIIGKSLKEIAKIALPKATNKIGDIAPVLKSVAHKPYVKQMKALADKDLLSGYKPNVKDILESARILTSPGMKIEHEAVNEAVSNALKGDLKPWFRLQSSVRSEGRRLSKKGGVHTELGDKLYNLAEKMHSEMGEAQSLRGAPEAEEFMNQGKRRTARYHKISPFAKIASAAASGAILPKWVLHMLREAQK